MNKKKFLLDFVLNLLATSIPLFILQFICLPYVNKIFGEQEYGLVVTYISLFSLISHSFGNSLNNARLISRNKYEECNYSLGDFNLLLRYGITLNIIFIMFSNFLFNNKISIKLLIALLIISNVNMLREYLIVYYRLIINYKKILLNNIILSIGITVGFGVFIYTKYWVMIYLIGYLAAYIHLIYDTKYFKEGSKRSKEYLNTKKKYNNLIIACFLASLPNYIDKIMLYPLLGGTAVSIYYASSIFGKIIAKFVGPINSVVLSYVSKMKSIKSKDFYLLIGSMLTISIIGFFISIIISKYLLKILYPSIYIDANKYIIIVTLTAIMSMISSIINPFIMHFMNIKYQVYLNIVNSFIYIIFGYVGYKIYGLAGFCLGLLINNIIKVIIYIYLMKKNVLSNNTN